MGLLQEEEKKLEEKERLCGGRLQEARIWVAQVLDVQFPYSLISS